MLMLLQLSSKLNTSPPLTITIPLSLHLPIAMRVTLLLIEIGVLLLVSPMMGRAQSIQYTQNIPEHIQRSVMRIDPATLGLGIQVPIADYKGRGGTSVPINLSYSSKVWRIDITDSFLSVLELPQTRSYPR